jgi:hypothetical protein
MTSACPRARFRTSVALRRPPRQEVVRACLANVVHDHDGDAVVVGEPLGVADGDVVRVVRGHALRGLAAHLGEDVDDDHAGVGVAVQPLCDGFGAALG